MPRTDIGSRFIGKNPAILYYALTTADALVRWRPPKGMSGEMRVFDPQPGGRYVMALTYEDPDTAGKSGGNVDIVEGRFVELVPNERVVEETEFRSDDPAMAGVMRITTTIEPRPFGAQVTVRCDNVPDGISAEDHAAGIASSLEQLDLFTV